MKTITLTLVAFAAFLIAGCAPPANTNTANTANANANAKPAAAPPTLAALKDLETKAFDAWKNKDGKFFEGFLDEKFVMGGSGQKIDKAASVKEISSHNCDVKGFSFSDEKMTPLGADAALIVMKATVEGTCGTEKLPSPVISASVYVRGPGDTWKGAYHNEVAIIDPKNPPPPPAKAPATAKDEAKPSNSNTSNSNMASNSNSSNTAAATSSPDMTSAWLEMEKKGWEAWRTKDAKTFEDILYKDLTVVDLFGKVTSTKADVIKMWTTDNKCEIKSTSVTDAHSVSFGKDLGILLYKGSADGMCEGMAVKPLYGTTVLVNEGGTWKAAAIIENPA